MDASTRALIIQRVKQFFEDGIVPAEWEQLPISKRIQIEGVDPQIAEIWSGKMSADTELALLQGKISADPVAPKTEQQIAAEKEAAIEQAFAALGTPKTHEELEAATRERIAGHEQARRNSAVMATGRWQ